MVEPDRLAIGARRAPGSPEPTRAWARASREALAPARRVRPAPVGLRQRHLRLPLPRRARTRPPPAAGARLRLRRGRAPGASGASTSPPPAWRCPSPYTDIHSLRPLSDGSVVLNAGAPDQPAALVRVDPRTGAATSCAAAATSGVDPAYLSTPRAVTFPTAGGETAHAFYYPPANRATSGAPGDLPPLLVKSHGGPTSATSSTLNLGTQYWTSRGIAVLDVNYGGSTGYGAPTAALDGRWGVVDVDDCVNGALALRPAGQVDPRRLLITGAAPAATPPSAPWPSATPSAPGAATTASATWRPWPRTRTSSSRATSTA